MRENKVLAQAPVKAQMGEKLMSLDTNPSPVPGESQPRKQPRMTVGQSINLICDEEDPIVLIFIFVVILSLLVFRRLRPGP